MNTSRAVETVEQAAIKWQGAVYTVIRPGGHREVIAQMRGLGHGPECMGNQGFVTSEGRFVNRYMAAKLAIIAGQTINVTNYLSSEDVW